MKKTVAEIITDKIIAELENGTVPWHKPWASNMPTSLSSNKTYRGLNLFVLSMYDFKSKFWATSKQITKLGGRVKYAEWKNGVPIQFWSFVDDDTDSNITRKKPIFRFYTVYNLDQTEGLPEEYYTINENSDNNTLLECENIINNYKNAPAIKEHMSKASYNPTSDEINIPNINSFETTDSYYLTLFHEITHSTGHASRLNRPEIVTQIKFGSENYSKEELVAEAGAALFCAHTGISSEVELKNSAAYIAGWLSKLKNDRKLIISAFSKAQHAVDYVIGKKFDK